MLKAVMPLRDIGSKLVKMKIFDALNIKPIVGLDIGSRAVKMVALKKTGDSYSVTAAAISKIDVVEAESSYQSSVQKAIDDCFGAIGDSIERSWHFVLGLSGGKVKVSSFNFPPMPLEEVEQAVTFEAAQVSPFDIRSSVVDYHLIGMDKLDMEDKKKVHPNPKGVVAIATQDEISKKRKIAEDASLKCVLMDSDGLALLNCLKESKQDNLSLPAAVINLGMSGTTLAILNKDGLPFIRDLRQSGGDIIGNIAEKIRGASFPDEHKTEEANEQIEILKKCKGLICDINETLAYYCAKEGEVKHIFLCGGLSQHEILIKTLIENINGEVSVWNPFSNMKLEGNIPGGDLIRDHGAIFAVAAGLAMRVV